MRYLATDGDCVLGRKAALPCLPLVLALVLSPASAQVNTEKLRGGEDVPGFSGSLNLDFSGRTGNLELVQVGVTGRFDYVAPRVTTLVVGRKDVGWKQGDRFVNEGMIAWRLVLQRGSTVRPEMFVQFNHNESRLLAFRCIVGVGPRTRVVRLAGADLWWGSAYLFEHERLDLEPDAAHPQRTTVSRWSNYLSSKIAFNEQSALIWVVYVQPQFDEPEDVRILGEANLGATLSDAVMLTLTVHTHYDSRPPDGKETLDVTIRTGIGIEF